MKFASNLEHFAKTINLIAYVFQNFQTVKYVIKQMSKKPQFTTHFDSQHAKASQTLLKSATQHWYHLFPLLLGKLNWEIYLFLTSEILDLFVNTLSADDRYSLHNKKNLPRPVQIQLSQKKNVFSTFCWISASCIKFWTYKKTMTLIAYVFQKFQTVKNVVW